MVVGASDRMLTAGDIQFEPPQSKIFRLSSSIAVMMADDSSAHAEVFQDVSDIVEARIALQPDSWWKVKDVADLYADSFSKLRRKSIERNLLYPLNLDSQTFLSRQHEMSDSFITQLSNEMYAHRVPGIAAIVTGVDTTGAHVYIVVNHQVACFDNAGFVAIGAGQKHASSHLMQVGHVRGRPYPETLLHTYMAKKHAEVAPGVGEATDMFIIGPGLGSYRSLPTILPILEDINMRVQAQTKQIIDGSEDEIRDFFRRIAEATTPPDQSAVEDEGGASANEENVRDSLEAGEPEDGEGGGEPSPS